MTRRLPLAASFVALLVAACTSGPGPPAAGARRFDLKGQVLAIDAAGSRITVHHDAIPGFMDAMTMTLKVRDASPIALLQPGDLITAALVVGDDDSWLEAVERTGTAPLPPPSTSSADPGVEMLAPGGQVPEATLVDQDGRPVSTASWAGSAVVLTFIYSRCPLPEYCPLMNRHFAAIQAAIKQGRVRQPVRLVSVSFDPEFDKPLVLRAHALAVGADPAIWRFMTAERQVVEAFGARFGLSVLREETDPSDITHNLRTALIDARGRLVKIYAGNEWKPDDVVNDLGALPPS